MNPIAQQQQLVQSYQLVLYDRALHPELFDLRKRRVVAQGPYELEVWVLSGGHVARFEGSSGCLCELISDQPGAPAGGAIAAMPCGNERDYDTSLSKQSIGYMTTVQSETLSENLYLATYEEMADYAREVDAVCHAWEDESGRSLSLLDIQRFSSEVHVQGYHLHARGGVVLRSQSIFECL